MKKQLTAQAQNIKFKKCDTHPLSLHTNPDINEPPPPFPLPRH